MTGPDDIRPMLLLLVTAAIWVGLHIGVAGTALRDRLVGRLGEGTYAAAFSVLSFAAISLHVAAWRAAETVPVWGTPGWARLILAAAMLPAFVLLACAFVRNPTAVGGGALLAEGAHGIQRVTRHPMLCAFAIWAAVHVLGNGDSAAIVFFGAFFVTAVAGMRSIDAKMARRYPASWPAFAAATSMLPFGAILDGRNRFSGADIGWIAPMAGALLWAAVLHGHRYVFGISPLG